MEFVSNVIQVVLTFLKWWITPPILWITLVVFSLVLIKVIGGLILSGKKRK